MLKMDETEKFLSSYISYYNNLFTKLAAVFTGISISLTLKMASTGAVYAARRFRISPGETDLLMKMSLNTTQISNVVGILTMTIYLMIAVSKYGWKRHIIYVSIITTWLNFVMFIIIVIAYQIGGIEGRLNFYYWSLVAGSLVEGLHESVFINIIGGDVPYYLFGMTLSPVVILLYHILYRFISRRFQMPEINFRLVVFQAVLSMFFWLFASIFWTLTVIKYELPRGKLNDGHSEQYQDHEHGGVKIEMMDVKTENLGERLKQAFSPACMYIMVMMFVQFLYPGVAPQEFIHEDVIPLVDLAVLLSSLIVVVGILTLTYAGIGPNRPWTGSYRFYHFTWFLLVVYYCCIILFPFMLHHPDSQLMIRIGRNAFYTAVLTIIMKFCEDIIRIVSLSGTGMQGDKQDGQMASVTNCIGKTLMTIFLFLGLGYLAAFKHYSRNRLNWPTREVGPFLAFLFWVKESIVRGSRVFFNSFTLNVREYFQIANPDDIWLG